MVAPARNKHVGLADDLQDVRPVRFVFVEWVVGQLSHVGRPVSEDVADDESIAVVSGRETTQLLHRGIVNLLVCEAGVHPKVGEDQRSRECQAKVTFEAVAVEAASADDSGQCFVPE